jgi:hypothetical protein
MVFRSTSRVEEHATVSKSYASTVTLGSLEASTWMVTRRSCGKRIQAVKFPAFASWIETHAWRRGAACPIVMMS